MTPEQILEIAHKTTAVPSLFISLVVSIIILSIVGSILFNYSAGRKKFFLSILISFLLIGFFFWFLSVSPNAVQGISGFFTKLWN